MPVEEELFVKQRVGRRREGPTNEGKGRKMRSVGVAEDFEEDFRDVESNLSGCWSLRS